MGRTVQMYLTRRKNDYYLSKCRPTEEQMEGWPEDGERYAASLSIEFVETSHAPLDLHTTAKVLWTMTDAPNPGTFA